MVGAVFKRSVNTPFLHALNAAIKPLQNYGVRVTCPPPARRYTGRRARRDAFYARQKLARLLTRIVRVVPPDWHLSIERAQRDMLVSGLGAVEAQWDRGDGEGFTTRPIEPGEWPRAMLRTRVIDATDFYPAGTPWQPKP